MFSLFSPVALSPADAGRLSRIERKLDQILRHLGIEGAESSALPDEVRHLADEGKKIEAIKAHREAFGSSLTDAKEAVEAYMGGR